MIGDVRHQAGSSLLLNHLFGQEGIVEVLSEGDLSLEVMIGSWFVALDHVQFI